MMKNPNVITILLFVIFLIPSAFGHNGLDDIQEQEHDEPNNNEKATKADILSDLWFFLSPGLITFGIMIFLYFILKKII